VTITSDSALTDIVQLTVPAGQYAVTAKAMIQGFREDGGATVPCFLQQNPGTVDQSNYSLGATQTIGMVTLQGTVSFAGPGTLSLRCIKSTGATAIVSLPVMQALAVDAVN
jgi:hypothetical protein